MPLAFADQVVLEDQLVDFFFDIPLRKVEAKQLRDEAIAGAIGFEEKPDGALHITASDFGLLARGYEAIAT